jgi:hypothetical protein
MSYDFGAQEPRQDLYDDFTTISDALYDLVSWSREATHKLYAGADYEVPEGVEWDGPTDDFLTAKSWELVALLRCK